MKKNMLIALLASLVLTSALAVPAAAQEDVYVERMTGTVLTLPDGWYEFTVGESGSMVSTTTLQSLDMPGVSIHYQCEDEWSALYPAEKKGLERSDVDLDFFEAQYDKLFRYEPLAVDIVVIRGVPYFKAIDTEENLVFVCCEDGYSHCYSVDLTGVTAQEEEAVLGVMETLLTGVQYATPHSVDMDRGVDGAVKTVLIVCVVVVGALLPYFWQRKKARKRRQTEDAPTERGPRVPDVKRAPTGDVYIPLDPDPEHIRCPECGMRHPKGTRRCSFCGQSIRL